jgi:hypothetical protein
MKRAMRIATTVALGRQLAVAGKTAAFAQLGVHRERLAAGGGPLDIQRQEVLLGPVLLVAQFEGEAPIGLDGVGFFQLEFFPAAVHVPQGGLEDFYRGVAETDVHLVAVAAQGQQLLLTIDQHLVAPGT